jgi:class 3 adenylate cyclase
VSEIGFFFVDNLNSYDDFVHERNIRVLDELKLANTLLKHDELSTLRSRLAEGRKLRDIDFYLLKKNGEPIFFENGDENIQSLESQYKPNEFVTSDQGSYGTIQVGGYLLVVGAYRRVGEYFNNLKGLRTKIVLDIALVAMMAMSVVLYFFKDFLNIIGIFKKRDPLALGKMRASLSTEAALMVEGLSAYQRQFDQAKSSEKILSENVRSSVRTELNSGKKPPYQFDAVMVRTDINNYSTLYAENAVEPFMTVINELFTRAQAVVERYGGYVTDFVGDEIIYYFKESEHENAAAVALSAVRDIHLLADELDHRTQNEFNYPFRVKSALSSGSLRFGPQAGGFALSGAVFVETVRILSQIDEKAMNSVYFSEKVAGRLEALCRYELKKTVSLRGVPGETRLYGVTDFVIGNKAQASQFFRGDRDLVETISRLGDKNHEYLKSDLLRALARLGKPSENEKVREQYLELLKRLLADKDPILATAISLARKVVSLNLYNESFRAVLSECLRDASRRVVANTVDALIHFEPHEKSVAVEKLKRTLNPRTDNRVLANVLVKQGMVELSEDTIGSLKKMIHSSDPLFKSSGIYAVGELALHYRTHDLPFYETHFSLQALLEEIASFTSDSDERVRSQVRTALEKAHYSSKSPQMGRRRAA